jgi:Virulence-associated protein E
MAGKPYLALLHDAKERAPKDQGAHENRQYAQSKLLDGLPLESLGEVEREPLNMEKLKSALWALADEWLASEGNWMMACRICANEAMRDSAGQSDVKQALWEALDERSQVVEGYDEADNRDRYERCIADFGKRQPPILAGSLYQEAERQGWVWTPSPSEEDAAAVGGGPSMGGGSGGAGGGGLWRGAAAPSPAPGARSKGVERLKGRSSYAQAHNLLAALPYRFSYDEFHDQCFYDGEVLADALIGRLREYCINASDDHRDPTLKTVREAAEALCDGNRFDPEKDWLNALKWDGVARIDLLLTGYCGVEDTPLARAVGRKFIIAKVLRALYPGCLHDWALVLEGPQGAGKTSVARILAGSPDRILDAPIMHEKPQVQQEALRGRTVQEIAEMSDMRRADTNTIKAYMSRTHDRARPAYAHSPRDQPRRCVYLGTTNDAQYLPDEDNRRFYPFKVGFIDLAALHRDREQFHAEALEAVRTGEDAVVPKHLWAAAAKEQRKRRIEDPWEDVLGDAIRHEIARNAKYKAAVARKAKGIRADELPSRQIREIDHKGSKVWFVSSAAILTDILRIEPAQQHGAAGRRARAVMGRLGWGAAQVKIDSWPTRGFIYDIAARGITAGSWDQYRDPLDDDDVEPANATDARPFAAGVERVEAGASDCRATSEEVTPESNDGGSYCEDEGGAAEGAQASEMQGVTFGDDEESEDEGEEGGPQWWRRRRRRRQASIHVK